MIVDVTHNFNQGDRMETVKTAVISETYFYFSATNRRLRYGDGRKIKIGGTHTVKGSVKLCEHDLHASKRIIDALQYAPGPILHLVTLGGEVVHGDDKSVATERTYVASFDATEILREFARRQALINIELIKPYCKAEEYELIVEYLKSGRENLRSAAWSAAESAAWSAESAAWSAWSAAKSAAWSAESAAWSAAESAAESAAWSAESAAWSAAGSAAKSAAESAAWSAESAAWSAESAARSAANKMLLQMIKDATGWLDKNPSPEIYL
jgi:hypothetical protein